MARLRERDIDDPAVAVRAHVRGRLTERADRIAPLPGFMPPHQRWLDDLDEGRSIVVPTIFVPVSVRPAGASGRVRVWPDDAVAPP